MQYLHCSRGHVTKIDRNRYTQCILITKYNYWYTTSGVSLISVPYFNFGSRFNWKAEPLYFKGNVYTYDLWFMHRYKSILATGMLSSFTSCSSLCNMTDSYLYHSVAKIKELIIWRFIFACLISVLRIGHCTYYFVSRSTR